MHAKLSILGAVAVLVLGAVLVSGVSHAQYPPPVGSVTAETTSTTVPPGGETDIACVVTGPTGAPAGLVPCTISITPPEGSNAFIGSLSVTKITNAQGIATATLHVGDVPGIIVVEVSSGGLTSTILVFVEGEAVSGPGSASPPQSPIDSITPPSTGSGGLAH